MIRINVIDDDVLYLVAMKLRLYSSIRQRKQKHKAWKDLAKAKQRKSCYKLHETTAMHESIISGSFSQPSTEYDSISAHIGAYILLTIMVREAYSNPYCVTLQGPEWDI